MWTSVNEEEEVRRAGNFILDSMTVSSRTNKPKLPTWLKPLAWIVGMLILAVLFGGCVCQQAQAGETQVLTASYYSRASLIQEGTAKYNPKFLMANGKVFNDDDMVCASWDFKLGTRIRVTNRINGLSVIVVVSDRTARRFKGERVDLSLEAMRRIDGLKQGLVPVTVEVI